jgi:hypothetical protein
MKSTQSPQQSITEVTSEITYLWKHTKCRTSAFIYLIWVLSDYLELGNGTDGQSTHLKLLMKG